VQRNSLSQPSPGRLAGAEMSAGYHLRHHHGGQAYVEYGLFIVAVALLAIIGLNAISAAQAKYFGEFGGDLNSRIAATDDIRHSTQTILSPPNCPDLVTVAVQFTCSVIILDTSATVQGLSGQAPPSGKVNWTFAPTGNPVSCTLAAVPIPPAPSPPQYSTCQILLEIDSPGTLTITATYVPDYPPPATTPFFLTSMPAVEQTTAS
jgi:hypothetical protein